MSWPNQRGVAVDTTTTSSSRRFRTGRKLFLSWLYLSQQQLFVCASEIKGEPFLSCPHQPAQCNTQVLFFTGNTQQAASMEVLARQSQVSTDLASPPPTTTTPVSSTLVASHPCVAFALRGGGGSRRRAVGGGFFFIPAGWNPWGYRITALGHEYLSFDGARDGDVGRFLASLQNGRRRTEALRASWLEIVRASKTGQSMRIYRQFDDLILFCLRAGFIN